MALRASNPIHASASVVFGWVGTKVEPLVGDVAAAGSRSARRTSYRSTNACDETKPRVIRDVEQPGVGLAAQLDGRPPAASPQVIARDADMNAGRTR